MAVARNVRCFQKSGAVVANDFVGLPFGASARVGDLAVDTTNGKLYICTASNLTSTSTWVVVGTQT
jgi:hypothetical protein